MIQPTPDGGKLSRLAVWFFRESTGSEPVRDWLKGLPADEKRVIGIDIKTVQFGWPIGMPGGGPHRRRHLGGPDTAFDAHRARVVRAGGKRDVAAARVHQEGTQDTES